VPLKIKISELPVRVTLKVPGVRPFDTFTVAIVPLVKVPVLKNVGSVLFAKAAMGKARAKSVNSITRLIFAPPTGQFLAHLK
jgi:hypothetical protein